MFEDFMFTSMFTVVYSGLVLIISFNLTYFYLKSFRIFKFIIKFNIL